MTGGRWSSQARFTVVVIGLALVGLGVFTTLTFHSNSGAAALVAGGVLTVLVGVAGGAVIVRGAAEQETRISAAGRAQLTGDAEGAFDRFVQLLRGYAPAAIDYHEAANAALYDAAGREGQRLQPVFGYFLGPIAMSNSLVVVDIRAGTGFSITRMQTTYQALLVGPTAAFNAALVIINTGPDDSILNSVTQLSTALERPVVAVSWRVGDSSDGIADAIVRLKREIQRLGLDTPRQPAIDESVVEDDALALFRPQGTYQPPQQRPSYPEPAYDQQQYGTPQFHQPTNQPPNQPPGYQEPAYQEPAYPDPTYPEAPADDPPEVHAPAHSAPPAQSSASAQTRIPTQVPVLVDEINPLDQPEEWPNPEPRRRPSPAARVYDDSAAWQQATDLHWRGQLQEAEDAYRQIVDARAHALGWDHPDTLTARDQHATVLRDLDRLAEALVECDEVLTARSRILGDDHPDTLTSRSHLATIYHQLGDLSRAETEHQRVLEARTRVLGANHQETLISRSNLAKVYQDMGELDRAIDEHHTVMRARSRLLGPEHRDTLMSRSLLASALHHAGRLTEAEAEHRSVLGSRLRLLGPVHLDTAVSRHRLASVLHDLGRLDEAIAEYRAAQQVYAQLLGASSPFARAAASDLQLAERAAQGGSARR
jgi:tetratricopeptide (TPR) repeat protein